MESRPWYAEYPPGVPAQIELQQHASATELVRTRLREHAQRTHSRMLGHDLRYSDLDRLSRDMGAFLQGRGIRLGDRVAIMLPNCPQYAVMAFALLRIGAIIVNVNPLYTPRELRHQMRDSGAVAILVLENFAHTVQAVVADTELRLVLVSGLADLLPWSRRLPVHFVLRHVRRGVPAFHIDGAVPFRAALAQGRSLQIVEAHPALHDVALLQYTGGTTGVSKGAMLTQQNLLASMLTSAAWLQACLQQPPAIDPMNLLLALPLYHVYGFVNGLMTTMTAGGMVVLVPNPRDIPALIRIWAAQPIHVFAGINTLYAAIMNHPASTTLDFGPLRYSGAGGAATRQVVAERWHALTGKWIVEGFGMSETSSGIAANPWHVQRFSGTAGVPMPGADACIIDSNDLPLPAGEVGELCLRGPAVMAGYWRQPEETRKAFTEDGFLRTGDMAVLTEQGHIRIVDRKKDMVLVSGFNVYPNEVEEVLAQYPDVLECAVIGEPDEHTGEAVCAVVVPRTPELDVDALRNWCRSQLSGYKCPRRVVIRQTLPKTPVGKILRRELRDQLLAERVH